MQNKDITLEICAASYASALEAQAGGADRIELCTALPVGGLTPSWGTLQLTLRKLDIPVCVLIRPREGDFLYSDTEFELMKEEIRRCKKAGAAGIVTGILTKDSMPDIRRMRILAKLAGPMEVVCHRAFDYVREPGEALEQLADLGFHRILTAGQQTTAWEGRELIGNLVRAAAGRIDILPGGGITVDNVEELIRQTGASAIHMTASRYQKSGMDLRMDSVRLNTGTAIPEFDYLETSAEIVREVRRRIGSPISPGISKS